jgi:putative two-component system hydrogenase maturation factor HypX/HoxX
VCAACLFGVCVGLSGLQGLLWATQLKSASTADAIRLPAVQALPHTTAVSLSELPHPDAEFPHGSSPATFQDMWYTVSKDVAYVHFDVLDGTMTTAQCRRLDGMLHSVCGRKDVTAIMLMGGSASFCTGYNLHAIHSAGVPAAEAWANISALTDITQRLLHCKDKITISAIQGDAAAGGLMTALACDKVWTHDEALLNPHYGSVGLHGSEHWTYTLPRRVSSKDVAHDIMASLKVFRAPSLSSVPPQQ